MNVVLLLIYLKEFKKPTDWFLNSSKCFLSYWKPNLMFCFWLPLLTEVLMAI